MRRLTRSMPSRWHRTWLRAGGRGGVLGDDSLDVRGEAPGRDVEGVRGLEVEVDALAGRQRGDQVREQLGGHGWRAVRVDVAAHRVRDPDLEIRRGQLQAGV